METRLWHMCNSRMHSITADAQECAQTSLVAYRTFLESPRFFSDPTNEPKGAQTREYTAAEDTARRGGLTHFVMCESRGRAKQAWGAAGEAKCVPQGQCDLRATEVRAVAPAWQRRLLLRPFPKMTLCGLVERRGKEESPQGVTDKEVRKN